MTSWLSEFGNRQVRFREFDTRDKATYSWPWENTGERRSEPMCRRVWPCALLIVIAKVSLMGNCVPLRSTGSPLTGDVIEILHSMTFVDANVPVVILASSTRIPRRVMISRVLLQRPCAGSVLRSRITGAPTLSLHACRGKPGTLIDCR